MSLAIADIIYPLSEIFEKYNESLKANLDDLKLKYPHISTQKLAYWQFCVESQKRAYAYEFYKKIFADIIKNHKKIHYKQLACSYYEYFSTIAIAPTFYNTAGMETFLEFKFTEQEYYEDDTINEDGTIDEDNAVVTVDFPSEIVNYNIYHAKDFLKLFKKYNDQSKVDAISAFSKFGSVMCKDMLTETRMSNIYIQPIHLFHDKVNISIDFNLTNKDLIEYITDLKKKFNDLSDEAKIMPSQLITRNMLNTKKNKFLPIDSNVASRIYSADESEYSRLLLMYDGLLIGISKSATSTLIAQILPRKSGNPGHRLSSDTQKFYMGAVALMTNDSYTSQCKLLENLKRQKLHSF